MLYRRHQTSPPLLLVQRMRLTILSSSPLSSPSWSGTSSVDIPQRTPTRIFTSSLRNTTPSSWTGCPLMLLGCGSYPSHSRIELVIGCRMKSLTHSPLGRFSPRPSSASTFHRAKLQSGELRSNLSFSEMENPFMRLRRGSKTSSGNALTMAFLISCKFRHSTTD